jgi:tRNA A-37 threonylcarbamoyl transferase component Bud32
MSSPAPSFDAPSTGDWQLGPYRMLSSLGQGATAQVFKAEHRHLKQLRALKIVRPEHAARPDIVGRLVTEARAMARLRHPLIAEVFECDVLPDGTAFIAMEYLPGEAMRSWMERVGKLAGHPLLAAAIVAVVAEGLAFAHRHGVVHRDLKPENVLLIPDASAANHFSLKIFDFGIAKLLQEKPLTRTRIGCVIGTPTYMAPEQWRSGGDIDHRADIYALGCMLFELLAGRPPFEQTSEPALMRAHLEERAPAVGSIVKGVPPALDQLTGRMLAKSPGDRPDAEAAIAALTAIMGQDRAQLPALLRTPDSCRVVAHESEELEPLDIVRAVMATRGSGAGALGLALSAWQGLRRWRRRLLLLAAAACLGGAAIAGAWLLRARPEPARSVPTAKPPAPPVIDRARSVEPPVSPTKDEAKDEPAVRAAARSAARASEPRPARPRAATKGRSGRPPSGTPYRMVHD